MAQELWLVRGLPGSGKSTFAREVAEKFDFYHHEADMFFMEGKEYKYDHTKIKEAHEWCLSETEDSLFRGCNVIVSNTFVKLWEIAPYKELAKKYCARFEIFEVAGNYKNVHKVPEEVIAKMRENWEELPPSMKFLEEEEEEN